LAQASESVGVFGDAWQWRDACVSRLQVAVDDVLLCVQEGVASSYLIWATRARRQAAVDYAARKAG